jgi:hypothetical protein
VPGIFLGGKLLPVFSLEISPSFKSTFSRKCRDKDVSQTYGPSWNVEGRGFFSFRTVMNIITFVN